MYSLFLYKNTSSSVTCYFTNTVLVASYKFEEQISLYEMTNTTLIYQKKVGLFKLNSPYRLRKNHMHSTNKRIELQHPAFIYSKSTLYSTDIWFVIHTNTYTLLVTLLS
jgi:hypothetical protein